jgi:uncharacterized membrane protein
MPEAVIRWTTGALELAGTGVIALGALVASIVACGRLRRGQAGRDVYTWYRQTLGRGILLGLELLVAADIIGTVAVEPSFRSVGVLALIVLVRTFLSFTLELEVTGRWPWQTLPASAPAAPQGPAEPPPAAT